MPRAKDLIECAVLGFFGMLGDDLKILSKLTDSALEYTEQYQSGGDDYQIPRHAMWTVNGILNGLSYGLDDLIDMQKQLWSKMSQMEVEKMKLEITAEQKDPAEKPRSVNGGASKSDDESIPGDEGQDNNEPDPASKDYPNTRVRDIDDDPCNFTVDLSCGMRVQAVEPREREWHFGYVVR